MVPFVALQAQEEAISINLSAGGDPFIHKISYKLSLFGRVAYNLNIGQSEARFEATEKGYDSFAAYEYALIAQANGNTGGAPTIISVEIESDDFLTQDGQNIKKIPMNFSGMQKQIGIGINL